VPALCDSAQELSRREALGGARRARQDVLLRVVPGVAAGSHRSIQTGGSDSKIGTPIADGEALYAIGRIARSRWLRFDGLHAHAGSQMLSTEPFLEEIDVMLDL